MPIVPMPTFPLPEVTAVIAPADHVAGPPQGQWTFADYAAIPDDGRRYEIIDGILYLLPSTTADHQSAIGWFIYYFVTHIKLPGIGDVLAAPFDVHLLNEDTVQPDVLVVLKANRDRIREDGGYGPPDLVVEIASPSTTTYDRSKKLNAYERSGVPEYWIVDPVALTIEVLVATKGVYRSRGVFHGQALLPSTIIPGFPVRVAQFFA